MQALVQEEKGLQEEITTHVDDEVHRKRMIQVFQEEIQAFKELKEEELEGDRDKDRLKWVNKQIQRCRKEIKDLQEGVNQ